MEIMFDSFSQKTTESRQPWPLGLRLKAVHSIESQIESHFK